MRFLPRDNTGYKWLFAAAGYFAVIELALSVLLYVALKP